VSDEYGVGDYIAVLGPLVILVGLLVLVLRSGAMKRMQDRAVDRRVGPGQGALFRRALEDGVIPPGADVAAWRTELAGNNMPSTRSGWAYLGVMVLVALFLLSAAATSDNINEALLNLIAALIVLAMGAWIFATFREIIRQRLRLIRLLTDEV